MGETFYRVQLKVKKLSPNAKLPTVAHPGEDLGYDLYASETVIIPPQSRVRIPCGIAFEFVPKAGALLRDRSSMAMKGLFTIAGVIDAGYRGEMAVLMCNFSHEHAYEIKAGDKIAQMIPVKPETYHEIMEVEELSESDRGDKGYGSSGK